MSEQILLLPYFYKGVIYLIENIQNHKKYIGKTSENNPIKYIEDHFNNALNGKQPNKYLYNAIRKYGIQNFKWRILGEVYGSTEKELNDNLNEAEIETIYFYRTFGSDGEHFDDIYGYNKTKGGDGVVGNTSWCKGLTKETSSILKKNGENQSILYKNIVWINTIGKRKKEKISNIKLNTTQNIWCRGLTKDTDERLKIKSENLKITINDSNWKKSTGALSKRKKSITQLKIDIQLYILEIINMYLNEKLTLTQIAKNFNCSISPIIKILKDNNIKFRTKSEARKIALLNKNIKIPNSKKVLNIDTNQQFNSIHIASLFYEENRYAIRDTCEGKREVCNLGFHWRYLK